MKKIKMFIKVFFILIFIFLLFKFILYVTTNKKEVEYKLNSKFKVYEKYTKENNYYISIKYKKYKFNYINDMNNHKKMKIVTDIKYFKDDGMFCVYPIFINNADSEIICNKDGKYYNYYSVKENVAVKDFVSKLRKEGYYSKAWDESTKYNSYNGMNIYNNVPNNIKIVVWNYTGIDIIGDNYNTVKLSNDDIYNNKLGTLIDNIYVSPDFSNKFGFDTIKEIDVNNLKIKEYNLDKEISYDSYINGVKDRSLYIMDKDSLLQFSYNLDKHKIKEIGNKDTTAVIYTGEKQRLLNIYDLRKKEIYFTNNLELPKLKNKYNISEVFKYLNRYYFITSDNKVYLTYEEDIDSPIFLFRSDSIIDFKAVKDYLFFIDEDNIYIYNRYNSLKKIITKNELLYNNKNIYDVYVD